MTEKLYTIEDMEACFMASRSSCERYKCKGDEISWEQYKAHIQTAKPEPEPQPLEHADESVDRCCPSCPGSAVSLADDEQLAQDERLSLCLRAIEKSEYDMSQRIRTYCDQVEKDTDYKLGMMEKRFERALADKFVLWMKIFKKSIAQAARTTLNSALASRKPYFEEFAEQLEDESDGE